jgi:hypothetical protein
MYAPFPTVATRQVMMMQAELLSSSSAASSPPSPSLHAATIELLENAWAALESGGGSQHPRMVRLHALLGHENLRLFHAAGADTSAPDISGSRQKSSTHDDEYWQQAPNRAHDLLSAALQLCDSSTFAASSGPVSSSAGLSVFSSSVSLSNSVDRAHILAQMAHCCLALGEEESALKHVRAAHAAMRAVCNAASNGGHSNQQLSHSSTSSSASLSSSTTPSSSASSPLSMFPSASSTAWWWAGSTLLAPPSLCRPLLCGALLLSPSPHDLDKLLALQLMRTRREDGMRFFLVVSSFFWCVLLRKYFRLLSLPEVCEFDSFFRACSHACSSTQGST